MEVGKISLLCFKMDHSNWPGQVKLFPVQCHDIDRSAMCASWGLLVKVVRLIRTALANDSDFKPR